jgi:hypothetical protein
VWPLEVEASAVVFAPCWRIKSGDKAFFMYGFAKNVQANVSTDQLKALKHLAKELVNVTGH